MYLHSVPSDHDNLLLQMSDHCTKSLPLIGIQNGRSTAGKRKPIGLFCSSNSVPFSRRAIMRRGIAAAVPLRVCAKGRRVSDGSVALPWGR